MLVNTTVSHISPLLTYLPAVAWYEDTPQADPSLHAFPNASYHATNATGASLSFSWWGKGLWVYGGYRESLGRYRVTLDRNSTEYDGFNGGPDVPGYQLFSAPNLPMGQHHISMFNIGNDPARPMFDFSYLMFESAAGNTTVFDHTSDQCVWLPHTAEAWAVDAVSHTTTQDFGSMGMNFTGTGVAVYGVLSAQSSSFDVTVDDATGFPLSPHTGNDSPTNETTLLYIKTDLYQGPHTLWVQNNRLSGSATATQLSISSLVVFSDAEASPSSTPPANTSMSPHSTVIFAAAFGALGAILLAVLIWRLLVFRRRRVQRSADVITARPFLVPTSSSGSSSSSASTPWGDPSSPSPPTSATFPGMREKAERRDHALVASLSNFGLLQPLRRPSTHASTAAPRYSVAATAPDSPDTPWPPEGEGAASGRPRTRRSTEKRSRRLFVASPVPTLPSARVPRRDRYDLVAEGMGDAPIMPPPYRFLDLH